MNSAKDEINILKNLLPMCSNCKKIRNTNGYWQSVESYIEMLSDIEVTHGMCDECAEKLYGNQDWYRKKNKKER